MLKEPDNMAPSTNYLANALKLSEHLEWSVTNVDAVAGAAMKAEIQEFTALYRKDKYTPYGIMPGLTSLVTAYDALSYHNARFGPGKEPIPEQLAGTINRNVAEARKQIKIGLRRAAAAEAEAAAGGGGAT